MKYSIIFIFLFCNAFAAFSNGELEKAKSVAEFSIIERKTDTNLPTGMARFKFSFYVDGSLYMEEVELGYNEKSKTSTPDEYGWIKLELKKGKHKLYFYIGDRYNEVITDSIEIKSQEVILAKINFKRNYNRVTITEKPVIYIYPEVKTEMKIELNTVGKLGFTYPEYNNGWNFTASPDGSILMNDKTYNYLFWESENKENLISENNRTGFLVSTDTLLPFLENSLEKMGLNSKESADFITYWYPRMMQNEKNHVQFLFNENCNVYAELEITPKPENLFRVGMVWCEAKTDFIPQAQEIPELKREGLTVIEWGGIEVNGMWAE